MLSKGMGMLNKPASTESTVSLRLDTVVLCMEYVHTQVAASELCRIQQLLAAHSDSAAFIIAGSTKKKLVCLMGLLQVRYLLAMRGHALACNGHARTQHVTCHNTS